MFFTAYETMTSKTFITLVSGVKGAGKSVRSERLAAIFPEETVVNAGSASARAGQNGGARAAANGSMCVYDEMIADLVASQSPRMEYWKQILLKRSYQHDRTQP
eukprot:5563000-Prymnesium_polylepis.1